MDDKTPHHNHPEGEKEKPLESATTGGAPAGDEPKKAKKAKAEKPKKVKKEKVKKVAKAKVPRDGVIKTILEAMQRDEGASATEIVEILKKKYPDRSADGMMTTTRIQFSRLPARCGFEIKKKEDEHRGLVYKAPKSARLDKKKEAAPAPVASEGEGAKTE